MPGSHRSTTIKPDWPTFGRNGPWAATQDYLHLVVQMLGKIRVGLASPLPEWGHTPLALTGRGLTTRPSPWQDGSIEARLDLFDAVVRLESSDGRSRTIQLAPARPIAELWSALTGSLGELDVAIAMWDKPQERTDVMPFSEDHRPRSLDPDLARSWFRVLTDVQAIFDAWRSRFFGRSGVNFWWGGFDLTVTLFNGRHAVPRPGSNYLMRYDLDADHVSVGFWPGDEAHEAMFFGYVVPEPPGCAVYPLSVSGADWVTTMREWVLSYESVRTAPDRSALVRQFADTILRVASELGAWDLEALSYDPPRGRPTSPSTTA